MQFFQGRLGKEAISNNLLNDFSSLYNVIKNDIHPLPYKDLDIFKGLSFYSKDKLPYLSVSAEYNKFRSPGGGGIVRYYPVILIDLDFYKKVKAHYTDPSNSNSAITKYVDAYLNELVQKIYRAYPYTLIKRSFSGSLHILINYRLLNDDDEIIVDRSGVEIKNNDDMDRIHKIHHSVYKYLLAIYDNLVKSAPKKILRADDVVGGKVNQLMIVNYDPQAIYDDNIYDIYNTDIADIFSNADRRKNLAIRLNNDDIIADNNTFIEKILELYNDDGFFGEYNRKSINEALSGLLAHHNFAWVASFWYLDGENRRLMYNIMAKKGLYKGSSIPLGSFQKFNEYIESKHLYHIKTPNNFVIPLKKLIKLSV